MNTLHSVWRQARNNHYSYSALGSHDEDLRFLTLGLVGEAGELANLVKKEWRDGPDDLRRIEMRLELADVMAYVMMVATALNMSPQDLLDAVAKKQQVFVTKMEAKK